MRRFALLEVWTKLLRLPAASSVKLNAGDIDGTAPRYSVGSMRFVVAPVMRLHDGFAGLFDLVVDADARRERVPVIDVVVGRRNLPGRHALARSRNGKRRERGVGCGRSGRPG